MTTTSDPSSTTATGVRRSRRVAGIVCLALPALAMIAFGGQLLVLGWLDTRPEGVHHVQDLAWGAAEGVVLLVALLAGLGWPLRLPAALGQALAVVVALLVTMALTGALDPFSLVLAVLIVAGVLLSPGRSRWSRRRPSASRPLVALGVTAAVALIPYALAAAAAQRAGGSPNAELDGYTGAALWALAVVGAITVASVRPRGWRVPASSAAAAVTVVGVASLLWPTLPSSLGTVGGLAAVAWAAAVLAVVVGAGRTRRARAVE